MPVPASPPYGVGSIPPRQLDRWLDVNSQNGPLTRTRGYVSLPAFNIPSAGRTYSEIVGVYSYAATNNFSLKNHKSFTNNGSYSLCIAYADSDLTVHRFVLVKGTSDNNLSYPPMYNGELIKKNFRLEIWDGIAGDNCVDAGFQMFSTVLGPLDYRYGLDFILGDSSTLCTSQNVLNELQFYTPPPSSNAFPLRVWLENHAEQQFVTLADGVSKVATWQGRGFGDSTYVSPPLPVNEPDFFTDNIPGTKYRLQFLGKQYLTGGINNNLNQIFIAVAVNLGGMNNYNILSVTDTRGQVLTLATDGISNFVANFNGHVVTADYAQAPDGQVILVELDLINERVNVWDGYTGILKLVSSSGPVDYLTDEDGNFITDENGNRITILI